MSTAAARRGEQRPTPIGPEFPTVLEAARVGADWAWRVLYRSVAPAVLGYLTNQGAYSPEDVCGDVFCDVARHIAGFQGDEDAFRGWVFLVARNRLIDERRRRTRRPDVPQAHEHLDRTDAAMGPEDHAVAGASTEEVRRILAGLPEPQREVLLLRIVGGLSAEEAARVLGKRPGAVRALQHRAVKTLRAQLGDTFGLGDGS